MRNLVEKSRKTVNDPVLAVGKRIDALAAEFQATLSEEETRLKKLRGDYAVAAAVAAQAAAASLAAEEAARLTALPVAAPAFVPEAPKGVKMVADYEVTDLDAPYRHNVGLVTLTERRKEILECIARMACGENLPSIPGLRIFTRPQVRTPLPSRRPR